MRGLQPPQPPCSTAYVLLFLLLFCNVISVYMMMYAVIVKLVRGVKGIQADCMCLLLNCEQVHTPLMLYDVECR